MRRKGNRFFRWMSAVLIGALMFSGTGGTALRVRATGEISGEDIGNGGLAVTEEPKSNSGGSGLDALEGGASAGDMLSGNTADVTISGVKVSGAKAGGKVTISFTVTGNKNSKKHYEVEKLERVYPVPEGDFPFELNDEAYRVTGGGSNSMQCSYTFQAKSNLETAYYRTDFCIVYSKKAIDGSKETYESEYSVNKGVSVKLTAKPTATPKPEKEQKAEDADVYLRMRNHPSGVYGGGCSVVFSAMSSKYPIKSVVPVISDSFPFESTSDAYKVVRSSGSRSLSCSYHFTVKKNVESGYQGVAFRIAYQKPGQLVTIDKTVNVELVGKKKETAKTEQKKSTPRLMVAGYNTNGKQVRPNGSFLLKLTIQNNAGTTVRNIKFTLSTENGEFLPVSGASTAFVDRIAAKQSVVLSFQMKAAASLGSKSYPVTVKSEYEDEKANAYSAEDKVSIPVVMKDRISLTDILPPDLSVGDMADLSFSINNLGGGALNNVSVRCKGKGFSCEKAFVGNIAAGGTGYANVSLSGEEATPEDSDGEALIIIKYENASGEHKKYTEKTNIYVMEAMDDEDMMAEEDAGEPARKKLPVPVLVLVPLAVVVAVILIIRHRKKKKRLQEEMMEDELL